MQGSLKYSANHFPFQEEFLQSDKSFLEFLAKYDLTNATSFFIKLNECDALFQILKNIASEYTTSVDLSQFTKVSEKIDFLKNNYFSFIEKKYSMNNFPKIVNFIFSENKILYAKYISHLSNAFWVKSEIYDYDQNFHTRRLKLCKILNELHGII